MDCTGCKTKKLHINVKLLVVECTGRTPNRLEEDMAKIAIMNEAPVENENRQEPRQKADYKLLKSHKQQKPKYPKGSKI